MSNDAEVREAHATVPDFGEARDPVAGDQAEPGNRPDVAAQDDGGIDPDAVIVAGGTTEPGGMDDTADVDDIDELDAVDDDTYPGGGDAETVVAEPVAAETIAAQPAAAPAGPRHAAADAVPTRPGMPVNGELPAGIPMAGDADQLHERWAAIQSRFVDDPRGSVTSAADLVAEVIATVVASARDRESGLRDGWDRDGVDTEGLRNALRSYRALLDELVAL